MLSRRKRLEEAKRRKLKIIEHHRRVLAQRPMVDTTAPRSMGFKHMKVNKKKEQAKRERQLRIWKRNQAINESLVDIETRKDGQYTERGAVNTKSLRLRTRLEEVDKINRDNARLYQNILKSRALGNAGSHAKYGASPMEGWKHHDDNFEEFRRRLLELPQVKKTEKRPTTRSGRSSPVRSYSTGANRGQRPATAGKRSPQHARSNDRRLPRPPRPASRQQQHQHQPQHHERRHQANDSDDEPF